MQSTAPTFLWYDYETFGANPSRARPAQFASIRTNLELEIIAGSEKMIYCKQPPDVLPSPQSSLITGITPQTCQEKGIIENDFAAEIFAQLNQPDTISAGYNSIRFDDEINRYLFWRNLREPYKHTWENGCSRWDLLDAMRCAYALRPEGINWAKDENGYATFKLEELTKANNLAHENAHDALSDVKATIALAKLLKTAQPKLFEYCLGLKSKQKALEQLNPAKPFIHISGMLGKEKGNMAIMCVLANHPVNKNEILAWDLSQDPAILADLKADNIKRLIFSKNEELANSGEKRLPIKGIHINKSPIIAPISIIQKDEKIAKRWNINLEQIYKNFEKISKLPDMSEIWKDVYSNNEIKIKKPVDEDLYNGFIETRDKFRLQEILKQSPQELAHDKTGFDDVRLGQLVFLWRARNWQGTLNENEKKVWKEHIKNSLHNGEYNIEKYFEEIDNLAQMPEYEDDKSQQILSELYDWAEFISVNIS